MESRKSENELFSQIASKHLSKFCFMVWDYFTIPKLFDFYGSESSCLCHYGNHYLLHGIPNEEILEKIRNKGEFVVAYDGVWRNLVIHNFINHRLVDNSAGNSVYNTFLCMELSKDNFSLKKGYKSREITEDDFDLLSLKQQIHVQKGFGGTCIVKDNILIGCAFAPHVVNKNDFSFAIIRDVWVDKSRRNKGYGYDLTSLLCKYIFNQDIERIFLWVEKSNIPAVKIYNKIGFFTSERVLGNICQLKKEKF